MEKIRTDRQIVFDKELIKFQKDHPEINANATSRKLWWDLIKQNYPDEFILLQEFIPCSEKDFKDLDRVYSIYKTTPTFAEEGFFKQNIRKPDFSKIVPADLPESFRKNCVNYMAKCFEDHKPFADLTCYDDFKSEKFTDFEEYSKPENFTKIEGGFRFRSSKYIYTFTDSLETQQRKAEELRISQVKIQNQQNQEYTAQLEKRKEVERIKTELAEAEYEKRKKAREEAEKLEKEKLQSSENPESPAISNPDGTPT